MNIPAIHDINIQKASAKDLPTCARIINNWIDETLWMPRLFSHQEIEEFFKKVVEEGRNIWVAIIDRDIAGYLALDEEAMIRALYLAPEYRNLGVGRQFLNHAKILFPNGLELGVFEANTKARKFYKREGFIEDIAGRIEKTDEGIPELLLRWRGVTAQ